MKIEKLPSGSYRVRKMYKGKSYSLTFDARPTKSQIEDALISRITANVGEDISCMTFEQAAAEYCRQKSNVLSANTYREYSRIPKNLPSWFINLPVDSITQVDINKVVNELSGKNSPKTVRNKHGFISAVLGTYRPHLQICTTLPQKRKIEPYIPSDDDVRRILEAMKDTPYYVPLVLACYGMRRGEIVALQPSDIEGCKVRISKSMAYTANKEWITKATKTTESERTIIIPEDIANLIRDRGYVYTGFIGSIQKELRKTQKRLEMQPFSLHKLRHYFASKMLTITDAKTVQALGGWKTDSVMKTVYAHSMEQEKEKARQQAVDIFSKNLFS